MAPTPEYDDDLLLLLVTLLLADHADIDWEELDPYLDELLRAFERRSFERSDVFSRLPFPPGFIFRQLRRSRGLSSLGRRSMRIQEEVSDSVYGRLSERLDRIERDIDRRLREVEQGLSEIPNQGEAERESILRLLSSVEDDLKALEWGLSIGVQPAELRTKRSIPVRIYLSESAGDEIHQQIINAVVKVLGELSFEKDTDLPEESGSWWKRFWARTKDVTTQEEVAERLQKLERAAEVTMLDKPQAAANKDHATAIVTLIKALKDSNKACIQAGNILILKDGDNIIVRTLSPIELRAVEKNQALLKNPQQLLQQLQLICEEPKTDPTPRKRNRRPPPKLIINRKKSDDT